MRKKKNLNGVDLLRSRATGIWAYSDCLLTCKLLKQLYKVVAITEAEEEVASSDDTGAGSAAGRRYL